MMQDAIIIYVKFPFYSLSDSDWDESSMKPQVNLLR